MIFNKGTKTIQWKMDSAGKTAKEWSQALNIHHIQKLSQNESKTEV